MAALPILRLLFQWQQQYGGELTRLAVSHAASLGQFDGWQASRPVTLWHVVKDSPQDVAATS